MPKKYAGDATLLEGRLDALEVALVTLMNMQRPETRRIFVTRFEKNIATFDDVTVALPISEEWREGLSMQAEKLLRPLLKNLPPEPLVKD